MLRLLVLFVYIVVLQRDTSHLTLFNTSLSFRTVSKWWHQCCHFERKKQTLDIKKITIG